MKLYLSIFISIFVSLNLFAQNKIQLKTGQKFKIIVSNVYNSTNENRGILIETKSENIYENDVIVIEIKENVSNIETTVNKMKVNFESNSDFIPSYTFDSEKDKIDEENRNLKRMTEDLKKLKKFELNLTTGKSKLNRNEENKPKEEGRNNRGQGNGRIRGGGQNAFSNNNESNSIAEMFFLNIEGKKLGDNWDEEKNIDSTGVKNKTKTTYIVSKIKGDLATLEFKGTTEAESTREMNGSVLVSKSTSNFSGSKIINTKTLSVVTNTIRKESKTVNEFNGNETSSSLTSTVITNYIEVK